MVRLTNVTISYQRRPAVHHLTGEFREGQLTAITGPNGGGKSTLLKALAGLLPVNEGRIEGTSTKRTAYLSQTPGFDPQFPMAVESFVAMGLFCRRPFLSRFRPEDRASVRQAIAKVGLPGMEKRPLESLSGGQLQRVRFARVLVEDAPLILLDEPFSGVDAKTTEDLSNILRQWVDEKRTVITVLHDLEMVTKLCGETLLLAREPVAWGPTHEVLNSRNLLQAQENTKSWHPTTELCEVPHELS